MVKVEGVVHSLAVILGGREEGREGCQHCAGDTWGPEGDSRRGWQGIVGKSGR